MEKDEKQRAGEPAMERTKAVESEQPPKSLPIEKTGTTDQQEPAPASAPESSSSPSLASLDVTPVITYPEFLVQPVKPPPLFPAQRLLNLTYAAGCVVGVAYCANRYVVSPMIASLVDARLALAGTTLDNLTTLNSKLEKVVSTPPKNHAARRGRKYDDDDEAAIQSDASSDSDPAELFHVDVGTQTTPGLSRSGSFSHISPASQEGDGATSKISSQQSRLNDIQDDLLAMNLVNGKPTTAERSLASTMRDLTSYLTSLDDESTKVRRGGVIYNGSSNSSGGRVAWPSSSSRDANTGRSPAVQEDAVDSFRAEIRGIKGVLLSAKNFPAAGGLGVGGVR